MATITIPKNLTKEEDLIILSRRKYEELLRAAGAVNKKGKTHSQFDKNLIEAIQEYKAGKFFGPFSNAKDLMKSLKSAK